jgi:hypothetical protein
VTPARRRRPLAAARAAAALGVLVVTTGLLSATGLAETTTSSSTSSTSTSTSSPTTSSSTSTTRPTSTTTTPNTTTTTVPTNAPSVPSIGLLAQSAWVGPTGLFELRLDTPLPADGQIQARIYVPISTQDQLDTTSKGESLGDLVEQVTVPAGQVARGPDGTIRLDYPMVADTAPPVYGFHLSNPGVYPFELRVLDADGTVTRDLVTQLIRLPDERSEIPAVSLAVVVPYGAPVSRSPDRTPHLAPSTLSALSAETAALARSSAVPVALAPVPETIDTLGEIDRASGSHKVADLATAIGQRNVVPTSYVPLASGSWLADGLGDGFDRQLTAGRATLATELGRAPSESLALTDATTTPDVLTADYAHDAREVVVSSGHLAATGQDTATATGALTQWFDLASSDGERLQAIPTDPDLEAALTAGSDPVLAAHHVLAALALIALDRNEPQACVRPPGEPCRRGLGLQLPADAAKALPALRVLLGALADPNASVGRVTATRSGIDPIVASALVQPVSIPGFFDVVDPASESGTTSATDAHQLRHLATGPVPSLGSYPGQFRLVSTHTDAFASMVDGADSTAGQALVTSWSKLVLASGAIGLDDAERLHYLARVETEVLGQANQITAPTQQTVTLTSASGKIPFSISNPLPYPVRVRLVFQSPKLHFVDGNPQYVTLPANQPRHLQIAVTARASGAFPMQVTITSPDGQLTISHTQFDVRSTAVSGIGLALTVAAGAFLLLWWARHYRDARRRRGLVESNHPVLRSDPADDRDHYAAPTD